jgi:hypothetical protein
MLKLIHFSDIHLTTTPLGWSWSDYFTKRAMGWLNLRLLGRADHFRQADQIVRCLHKELQDRRPQAIIFSGDASHLGFPREIQYAADMLGLSPVSSSGSVGIALPGNHDYYVTTAAASGAFERCFAPWQQGLRLRAATYPFALRVGPVWLIAVPAAQPHRTFWDASGCVGPQLWQDLYELCQHLHSGWRIAVCHYPLLSEQCQPEPWYRCLRDRHAAYQWIRSCGIALWLHGHRHRWYWLPASAELPCPTIGAGSATQSEHAGYLEYCFHDQGIVDVYRRRYDPAANTFVDDTSFSLTLAPSP